MIIYVGANKFCMLRNDYSFCANKFRKRLVNVYAYYNFELCHVTAQTSHLYGFTKMIKYMAYIIKFLCKNCLHADYS